MSDSDTSDSDSGVRYKTTTTRHNQPRPTSEKPERPSYRDNNSSSSRIRSDRRYHHRSRSPTPERRRYRRRSRTPESSSRSHRSSRSARSSRNASPEPSRRVKDDVKPLDVSVSSVSSHDDHTAQRRKGSESPTECFGPALPPALAQPSKSEKRETEEPAKGVIGPALPPHLLARKTEHQDEEREEKTDRGAIGPALPPGMKLPEAQPSHDHATSDSELSPFSEPEQDDEPDGDDGEDDEMIGPLPGTSGSRANVELEQRALEMKIRQIETAATGANGDREQPKAREDWMLELPDIRKISDMGLGARQFRTREKQEIGDRTVWTDTPADRERKKASGGGGSSKAVDPAVERERERERKLIAKRDKEQEELVKRHKKKHKRDKALLEIHQKKLKKEKESKGAEESIRRPFDRNVDLQANRFDEAQKKAVLKKAQLLDTRFSSGSSKYL
ncbi:GPALPP motifs-containing protein 1 [Anopheles aquasalis]|uniref:GPALPP motifs-containing protein 1 n=1 Tax=Anopheles aquasalis TaxID=42839 RepID=UPI00215A4E63|nr:GPALPP motifs-containing protein 1 [Anopheles aquasalis]